MILESRRSHFIRRLLQLRAPGVLLLCILIIFHTHNINLDEVWDALEVCSGEALLSRCLRFGSGLRVAAFDIDDWGSFAQQRGLPCHRNPLDMTTSAGMALLLVSLLRAKKRVIVHFGVPCSSWVLLSRATTARTWLAPLGDCSVKSVADGNLLAARMCILIYIILAHQGHFTIEQPSTSLLFRHPRFQQIISLVKVWRVHFWMRLLGSKYPKRSVIYSSSPKVWRFKTGHLRMGRRKSKGLLVKHYRDSTGRARFVGKKVNLKHSARYPLGFGLRYLSLFSDLQSETSTFKDLREVPRAGDIDMEDFLESLQTNLEDTWGDAQMAEVCQYLYGNTDANLPPEVKQYLPRWL